MITCHYMLALACKGEILCILLVFIMHNLRCSTSVVASAGTCDTQKQNKPKHPLPPKQQHILLEPCQVNTTNQCSQQNYSKVQARPISPELGVMTLLLATVSTACAGRTGAVASVERKSREPDRVTSPE
jgi:hypothetical protein